MDYVLYLNFASCHLEILCLDTKSKWWAWSKASDDEHAQMKCFGTLFQLRFVFKSFSYVLSPLLKYCGERKLASSDTFLHVVYVWDPHLFVFCVMSNLGHCDMRSCG